MPRERIEIVHVKTGRTVRRFGVLDGRAKLRLLALRNNLATVIQNTPSLQRYRAADLAVRRVAIDEDVTIPDDDPDDSDRIISGTRG